MPTSKGRKQRLIARQKERQKIAIEKNSKVGLKRKDRHRHFQTVSSNSGALSALLGHTKCDLSNEKSEKPGDAFKVLESVHMIDQDEDSNKTEGEMALVVKTALPGTEIEETTSETTSNNLLEMGIDRFNVDIDTESHHGGSRKFERGLHNQLFDVVFSAGAMPFRLWKKLKQVFCIMVKCSSSDDIEQLKARVSLLEQEVQNLRQSFLLKRNEGNVKDHGIPLQMIPVPCMEPLIPTAAFGPPPPPPPLPPPPLPLPADLKRVQLIKPNVKKHKTCPKNQLGSSSAVGMKITNDQLRNVKLKKVSFVPSSGEQTPAKGLQLVTLKDLNNIKLRKTPSICDGKENTCTFDTNTPLRELSNLLSEENIGKRDPISTRRTPYSGYNLRKTLRKVNLMRSPGGTPLVKSKPETGAGLTPMLTAALRRKFKSIKQPSLESSPDFLNNEN